MDEEIGDLVRRRSHIGLRPVERREDIGRRRERPDAVGDRRHLGLLVADFGAVAEPVDAEPAEIGLVDRDGVRGRKGVEIAGDQIPGMQPAAPVLEPTMKTGVVPPLGTAMR